MAPSVRFPLISCVARLTMEDTFQVTAAALAARESADCHKVLLI
ncbi:MAG: hypothetical protein PHV82_00110 [Victivallaceae bacterium]|nr:hypothetical protein [Victivallaceae bacterium]